jgi:hypothetical protein
MNTLICKTNEIEDRGNTLDVGAQTFSPFLGSGSKTQTEIKRNKAAP